jgi:hypothetical protein
LLALLCGFGVIFCALSFAAFFVQTKQNDHIDEAHMIHCATNLFIYYSYYRERCGVFCASALDKS